MHFVLLLLCISAPLRAQDTVFVSPRGDDQMAGRTRATAVLTLERARDLLRARRAAGTRWRGAVVFLLPGDHLRDRSFVLGPEDGGTPGLPVTYAGGRGGRVRILGAERAALEPVSDPAVLRRLPMAARARVKRVSLPHRAGVLLGIGDGRRIPLPELFDEGGPLTLARWPDTGWVALADPPDSAVGGPLTMRAAAPWPAAAGMYAEGYFRWDWSWSYAPVLGPGESGAVRVGREWTTYGWKSGQRIALVNVLEQLDRAGRYAIDAEAGALYVWPVAVDAPLWVGTLDTALVTLDRVHDLRFDGIVFGRTGGSAIAGAGTVRVTVARSTIEWTGGEGVALLDGRGTRITRTRFTGTSGTALHLGGGDRQTLTPSGIVVGDNVIRGAGRLRRTERAVQLRGVGIWFVHNEVADGDFEGILIKGNDHRILNNDLHGLLRGSADAGVIYLGRDWTERGTLIARNWIHDIGPLPGAESWQVSGVYLDDGESGVSIVDNVFSDVPAGIHLHGGHGNAIEGNLFLCTDPAVYLSLIGPWVPWGASMRARVDSVRGLPAYRRFRGFPELDGERAWTPSGNVARRNQVRGGRLIDRRHHLPWPLEQAENVEGEASCLGTSAEAEVWREVAEVRAATGRPHVVRSQVGPRPE